MTWQSQQLFQTAPQKMAKMYVELVFPRGPIKN